jgi:hypothetical protein
MPPPEPLDPPVGHIAPYPPEILRLGENRWLTTTGEVINMEFGDPVDLKPNTLAFWEAAAVRGPGKPLSDLFDGLNQREDSRFLLLDILEDLLFDADSSLASDPESKQASWAVNYLKKRIDRLKTDLVIELGGDGVIVSD